MGVLQQFDLSGKTALVTGCNKGIGKGMALGLAEAGADIIGVSASLGLSGSEVEKEVTALGKKFKAYQADLSDRKSVYTFIEKLLKENKVPDILINNAGTIRRAPAAAHGDEDWDFVMNVNLDSQFILAREIGKHMLQRGSGKIVFTCSMLTFQGGINVISYAASKGALASLIMGLSNEWAGKGVNVNGIAPGYIDTDNTKPLQQDAERNKAILARIPAARWGNPEDLKGAVVFLSSDAAAYVNGTILAVDGGWLGR
ncbi:MAG: SDR family NAD(P)-dependent oxidoreductase [Chitinophagaceae bacterium]